MGADYSFLRVTNTSREQLKEHLEAFSNLPDESRLVVEDYLSDRDVDLDPLGGSYDDARMSYYDYEYDYDTNEIYEWNEADQIHDTELELPCDITIEERNEYGYFNDGMYPMDEETAVRLGLRGMDVYRLYSDNTDSLVEQLGHIRYHDGLFGVEAQVWNAYVEDRNAREERLLNGDKDWYGIYQLKHNEKTDNLRFMDLSFLQRNGLEVNKGNYQLEYDAPMQAGDTPSAIFQRFNIERPDDFYGHSLSVSDVVVFHKDGRNNTLFVNDFGFYEVPDFFRNGIKELREQPDELAYRLGKHYLAIQTVDDGYDYTFYDENYKELDGGIYDDPSVGIQSVLMTLVSEEDALDDTYDNVLKESEHLKKVLVTDGMSNDGLLVETDAPISMLRQWAFQFSEASENGKNWDYEIPGYKMNVLFDSELNEDTDLTVRDLEADIVYDLGDFGREDYEELMEKVGEVNAIPIPKDIIKEFRGKTAEHFKEAKGVSADDIEAFAIAYATTVLDDYDLKGSVRDAVVIGSRARGLETDGSDVDVVLEFESESLSEAELFELLHEDGIRIGGMELDINPITPAKSGTLEEYLPKAEAYLEEKKMQIEAKPKAWLEYYAAECIEFPTLGECETYDNLADAIKKFREIPPERMHGVPGIGFVYHDEGDLFDESIFEAYSANHIDFDMFMRMGSMAKNTEARAALEELYRAFPEAEIVNWDEVNKLASDIDQFCYEFDTYEYQDNIDNRLENVQKIAKDIREGNNEGIEEYLHSVIDDEAPDEDMKNAEELLRRLDDIFIRRELNPLTKVEEQVEENFDMIDGTLNNMAEEEPDLSKMSIHERMEHIKQRAGKEPKKQEQERGGVSHDTLD